mgnify:CR=1 FL=1
MRQKTCSACGGKMQSLGNMELQKGRFSMLFGNLSQIMSGALDVDVECCERCKKLEFYLLGDPERFDIVICDYPNTEDGMYRVKRVIGLPGETIELKKGELYVNGEFVEQNFEMTPNETDFGPFTVPEGHYFVMGDNRNESLDSRSSYVGCIDERDILGKVLLCFLPVSDFGVVK